MSLTGRVEDQQDLDVFADADTVATRTVVGGRRAGDSSSVGSKGKKGKGGDFQSIFAESLGAGASALGESIDDGAMDEGGDGDGDEGTSEQLGGWCGCWLMAQRNYV